MEPSNKVYVYLKKVVRDIFSKIVLEVKICEKTKSAVCC